MLRRLLGVEAEVERLDRLRDAERTGRITAERRLRELDAAAAVVLVGVVGSTCSGPLLLVLVALDEPPPVAGDIAVGFPSMEREPAPVDAVLEYVRLAFC